MKRITTFGLLFACSLVISSCRQSPQSYVARGNKFYETGRYDDAILNYKKAIQRDARFGEAYYRLGLASLKKGDSRGAYGALTSAHNLLHGRADVQVTLADFLLLAYLSTPNRAPGVYKQLTQLSDELLAADPKSYDGLRIKGNLAWTDGQLKQAEEYFSTANSVKPMMSGVILPWVQALFKDGQPAEAERLALELVKAHQDASRAYDLLFLYYRSQNRTAEAENMLRSKVENNPREAGFALELAMYYAAAGKRDQMSAALQRLLGDPKTFPDAHLKVGDFYGALHDWPEALREYQQGTQADPKNKPVYLKRIADAWLAQGKGEEAASVVGEILKEQPQDDAAKAVNATLLIKSGKPEKIQAGVNDLQELVKKTPDSPVLRFTLGRALFVKGDVEGARAQFQETVKVRPNYLPAILALAEVSQRKRDYDQVLKYADQALVINPKLGAARLLRALGLLETHKLTEARTELSALAIDAPQNPEVQFQLAALDATEKDYAQAEARLEKLYDKDRLRTLAMLTEIYRAEGHLDKAISRLTLELGKSPNTVPIHALMADVLVRSGKYEAAAEQFKQMQTLGLKSAQLDFRLGSVYQLKGEYTKALASFQAAKDQMPNDPTVNLALADALRMTGRTTEAMVIYRRVLTLDPENANAMNNLAYVMLDAGGSPDEAQKLVERALQKSPKSPNFADTLGMVYLKKNLDDSALQVFGNLTQKYPDNPVFLYHHALSLTEKGQKAKAKTELEVALRKSPPDDLKKSIQTSLAKIQQ